MTQTGSQVKLLDIAYALDYCIALWESLAKNRCEEERRQSKKGTQLILATAA